jgi:hypothetical protein
MRMPLRPTACFCLAFGAVLAAQGTREEVLTTRASGAFDVTLTPQSTEERDGITVGRSSIDKRFHGPLQATSRGEMLTALTSVKGSAGYVAIERVTGRLDGRTGTFVLQHDATMTRGAPELTIVVVPDSATGELAGLSGRMGIRIEGGKHFYDFDYTLPPRP